MVFRLYKFLGTMKYADGSKYEGEWKNDMRAGKGTLISPEEEKYEGDWEEDKITGKGINKQ